LKGEGYVEIAATHTHSKKGRLLKMEIESKPTQLVTFVLNVGKKGRLLKMEIESKPLLLRHAFMHLE